MKVRIDHRFCGPPDSGNGGYVAGMVARALGGSEVEVTLRAPPPLDVALDLRSDGRGSRAVGRRDADRFGQARGGGGAGPPPPSSTRRTPPKRALPASSTISSPAASCAGPIAQGRGCASSPGAADGDTVAASWTPAADLADAEGRVGDYCGRRSTARAISRCARRPGWRCSDGSPR